MFRSISRRCFITRIGAIAVTAFAANTLTAQQARESLDRDRIERPGQNQPGQSLQHGQQRPAPQTMQEKDNPELDRILKYWEYLGTKTTKLEGKHHRFTYDFTFNIQKRAQGEWYYETPDKGRLDISPVKLDPKQTQVEPVNRYDEKGGIIAHKMTVEADVSEAWICDGKSITLVHVDKREYEKLPIPSEAQGKAIEDGPLPFLFGIAADKAKMRYSLDLLTADKGGKHDLSKGIIHILARPKWMHDANNFTRAEVILDSKTFFPTAIKLVHPGEKQWTVYTFYDVKRNENRSVFKFLGQRPL